MEEIVVRESRRAVLPFRLRGDRLLGPLLLAPSIAYIAALVGLPLLLAIYLSVIIAPQLRGHRPWSS